MKRQIQFGCEPLSFLLNAIERDNENIPFSLFFKRDDFLKAVLLLVCVSFLFYWTCLDLEAIDSIDAEKDRDYELSLACASERQIGDFDQNAYITCTRNRPTTEFV